MRRSGGMAMVVGRYPINPRTPNERGSASTRVPRIFARHPDFLLEVPVEWSSRSRPRPAASRNASSRRSEISLLIRAAETRRDRFMIEVGYAAGLDALQCLAARSASLGPHDGNGMRRKKSGHVERAAVLLFRPPVARQPNHRTITNIAGKDEPCAVVQSDA